MVHLRFAALSCLSLIFAACSSSGSGGFDQGDSGGSDDGGGVTDAPSNVDSGLNLGDAAAQDGGNGKTVVYAHSDTELYAMDPTSHVLTDIGPFMGGSGAMTDCAVNGDGDLYVNSSTVLYKAALPASGTGPVQLTQVTPLKGPNGAATRFYALGFVPAGVLDAGEALVAGDSAGHLYFVDTGSGQTADLGGFGSAGAPNGEIWELSGDVVFYMSNGSPKGLATIRHCTTGSKPSCTATNDSLAEIDMPALIQAHTSGTQGTLLKQILGTATGFGRLFGIGAWGDKVFGFSREEVVDGGGPQAQLVAIDATGTGTSLQSFPNIMNGWSGAGVTTKADITIVK